MTVAWRPNPTAPLWYEERGGEPVGPFFHNLSLQLPDSQSFSAVLAEARLPRGLSESLGNSMRSLSQSEIGGAY